jgi:hypothetical protein
LIKIKPIILDSKLKNKIIKAAYPSLENCIMEVSNELKLSKPTITLQLILNDINKALNSIEKAVKLSQINNIDDLIITGLWQQAIMSYCRCFRNSEDGFSTLNPKLYLKSLRAYKIHADMMTIRDSYIAHRGNNEFENVVFLTKPSYKNGKYYFEFSILSANRQGHYFSSYKTIVKHMLMIRKKVEKRLKLKIKIVNKVISDKINLL